MRCSRTPFLTVTLAVFATLALALPAFAYTSALPAPLTAHSPDGTWAATWHPTAKRLELTDRRPAAGGLTRDVVVYNPVAGVEEMVWLSDGSGVALNTAHNVYVVRFDPSERRPDAAAHRVFATPANRSTRALDAVIVTSAGLTIDADGDRFEVRITPRRVGPPVLVDEPDGC